MHRRRFLETAAAGLAGPLLAPPRLRAEDGAANERIQIGCIGVGGMGTSNLRAFLGQERAQVVAVCDVDARHRRQALQLAGLDAGHGYADFRELLDRDDLDAVMIATPDHWHGIITSAALRAGLDVYCEKPLAASIAEGRFVSDLARRERRVLQCGTWRRSVSHVRKACELVRNGYIGELRSIEVGVPGSFEIRGSFTGHEEVGQAPDHLDYAMWLGPRPAVPYREGRCHFNFRWVDAYAPGYVTDWGAHFLDVAQWGNGSDDTTPVEVRAERVSRRSRGYYDAVEGFRIHYRYGSGVAMTMFSTDDSDRWGTRFVGTEGWVFTENTKLATSPASLLRVRLKDGETRLVESRNHHENFLESVVSRREPSSPVEAAHRAASTCHLGAIAIARGRPLRFDPGRERFDDASANELLMPEMHGGWSLS